MAFIVAARSAVFFIRPMNAQPHSYLVASKGLKGVVLWNTLLAVGLLSHHSMSMFFFFPVALIALLRKASQSRLLGPPHQRTISSVLDSLFQPCLMIWPDQLWFSKKFWVPIELNKARIENNIFIIRELEVQRSKLLGTKAPKFQWI